MSNVTLSQVAEVLFPDGQRQDYHVWGTIESFKGNYAMVKLNSSSILTQCTKACGALKVGSRVLVLIKADGKAVIVASMDDNDAVIAQGKTNGWDWVKYASGRAECYIDYETDAIPIDITYGSLFKGPAVYLPSYPISFVGYPQPLFSVHRVNPDLANTIGALIQQSTATNTRPPAIELLRAHKNANKYKYGISCLILGRWK